MIDIDYSIKELEKSVDLGGEIKHIEISRLTAPGENFTSLVLKVEFEIIKHGQSKIVSTVAKRLPMGERKNIEFNAKAMKNEITFYNEIVPLIRDFGKDNGIEKLNFFPECFGSRYSCDSTKKEVNNDSFLLLENLIPKGYRNEDRYKGFDLTTTKAIIKEIALLHSVTLAMKFNKPDLFKVMKEFFQNSVTKLEELELERSRPPPGTKDPEELLMDIMINIPECSRYVDRLKIIQEKLKDVSVWFKPGVEPWCTLVHGDLWINNIMIKHREGKEPLVKFVDFQMPTYGSYAKDLLCLLLTSVDSDTITHHMDDLLWSYYEEFISVLKKVKVDLELTFTAFLKELRRVALEVEVQHAILLSTVVFGEKNTALDHTIQEFDRFKEITIMIEKMNQQQKDKLSWLATEAGQRNWL